MKNISNVLELSGSTFELGGTEQMHAWGGWQVKRDALPSSLPKPFDWEFKTLNINLSLVCSDEEDDWNNGTPFKANLEIQLLDAMEVREECICCATRDLAIQHLWSRTQMKKGVTFFIPEDPSCQMTDYDLTTCSGFYGSIIGGVLAGIIKKPMAVIRWDEQGLAVTVSFGATYISTREHYADND